MPRRAPLLPLALLALLAPALAGCAQPDAPPAREPVWVGPPEGAGGFAPCASTQAQEMAIPGLFAEATNATGAHGHGIHRVDERTILWVWADYQETPRRDRLTRLNPVTVHREPSGEVVVCTQADLAAEVFTDGTPATYAVAARVVAPHGWPEGPMHVVVNWVVGCTGCAPPLRGNTTAHFA